MATKRFIITELENKSFRLVDKKTSDEIICDSSFERVYNEAKKLAQKNPVFGITNIVDPNERHPKFKSFKTPVRCAYEFVE